MAKKIDAPFDLLLASGATSYLDLAQHLPPSSTFVITGRLTP
ncbi:MAG: hypothetical protein PVJ34_18060 [Anaerolineae bacterium]|jgi:hypothetical protein